MDSLCGLANPGKSATVMNWNRIEEIEETDLSSQIECSPEMAADLRTVGKRSPGCTSLVRNVRLKSFDFPTLFTVVSIVYETKQFSACRIVFENDVALAFEGASPEGLAIIQHCVGLSPGVKVLSSYVFKWNISDNCWLVDEPKVLI